jgi:oligopeptide/dipeptide ABC transporter ATP-binding protein
MADGPFLSVSNVRREFTVRSGSWRHQRLTAVDNVSLAVRKGETFGIVGESGCGKSTLARMLVALLAPTSGTIEFDGKQLPQGREVNRPNRELRGRLQIVFQDPYSSLNPWMTIAQTLDRPLRLHGLQDPDARRARVKELLAAVGLPLSAASKLPHQFSGGQRQRIAIARSLATNPDLIVADEVTSALDVSVQATILNLLRDLQAEMSLTYVLISHDMRVIHYMCDRVAVMYLGQIVEQAGTDQLFSSPEHPYTRLLLASAPEIGLQPASWEVLEQQTTGVISPLHRPTGCVFHPRCNIAVDACRSTNQQLREIGAGDRLVACDVVAGERLSGLV